MSTITFVGSTTAVSAVNASVAPTFHGSTAAGDLVLIHASIRNSGAGVPVQPAGWATLLTFGNESVFGRIFVAGDTPPTVAFTGGVALADTIVQSATWRGVSAEVLTALTLSATQLNGSAQDILYPALAITKDRHLVLLAGWKQDDSTAVSTPAGFTSCGTATGIVAGDDATQAWRYSIQTAAATVTAGTLTVTGGAAAISRAMVLALKPAASLAVTLQSVYPPRVLVSLTDLTLGDTVQIYRQVSSTRTALRAATSAGVTDPSFLRVDAEIPFGVPVSYVAVVNGVEYATAPVTYTLTGGKVAISDAVTGLSAEVTILAWPEKQYDRRSSTFRVGGRNVAVIGDAAGFSGSIELYVETTSSVENLQDLLAGATEGVVQVRQPGGYDGVDSYVAVLGVTVRRWSQDGSDQRRVVVLDALEVEAWADALQAATYTYADLETLYTGLTYADLATGYATYLTLAQAQLA